MGDNKLTSENDAKMGNMGFNNNYDTPPVSSVALSATSKPKTRNIHISSPKQFLSFKGNIENESCSTTWVDRKTIFQPFPNPKKGPLVRIQTQNGPKLS